MTYPFQPILPASSLAVIWKNNYNKLVSRPRGINRVWMSAIALDVDLRHALIQRIVDLKGYKSSHLSEYMHYRQGMAHVSGRTYIAM